MRDPPAPPEKRPSRRILWAAIAASVAVHLVFFAVLSSLPQPPARAVKREPPITVSFVELPPAAPPSAAPSPPPSKPLAPSKPSTPAPKNTPERQPPAASAPSPERAAPGGGATDQAPAPAPAPRLRTLVPDSARMLGQLELPQTGSGAGTGNGSGRTIRNTGEPDEASRRVALEAEAAQVGERVGGWSRDLIAEVRVRDGAIDDYFRVLGNELERRAQVQRPLDVKVREGLQRMVQGYFADLEQYGTTGAPSTPRGLGKLDEHLDVPDRNGAHEASAEVADQYARVQEHIERFGGSELVIVVELSQDALGRIVSVAVLQRSGDRRFDEHIVRVAGEGEFPGVPDHVAARSPGGIRTVWEFRGRYDFKKKLREMDVNDPADAAYLAAMGLGSLFAGGGFDEVTGDIYVIDVRDPKFEVRSKLLRLY